MSAVDKRSWEEFRESKMLWWINRILHTFGWAIVLSVESDGTVSSAFPAKVSFRGFSEQDEAEGFEALKRHADLE